MADPLISVVIPVYNEQDRIIDTIRSIAETRTSPFSLEVVLVDDASTDGCIEDFVYAATRLGAPALSVHIYRLHERVGVPLARNAGASVARGEILFMTDAHVRFTPGWDRHIFENIRENRILTATIADMISDFKGHGCRLIVPFMGTYWNKEALQDITQVQIATCSGTVLMRELFQKIGGYDPGMKLYSAAEPEFSVRAWLSGAEIVAVPQLQVLHRFKNPNERNEFLDGLRPFMIHNSLRFGMLYLSERAVLQMVRHFAMKFPQQVAQAYAMIVDSDVWERRESLENTLEHDFNWFIHYFGLKDQIGHEILT